MGGKLAISLLLKSRKLKDLEAIYFLSWVQSWVGGILLYFVALYCNHEPAPRAALIFIITAKEAPEKPKATAKEVPQAERRIATALGQE